MGKKITVQGFKIKKNLKCELFTMAMPISWGSSFYSTFTDMNSNKKLKTKELQDIIYSLHSDIVYVGDFYNCRFDTDWIVSVSPISKELIWAAVFGWLYSMSQEVSPILREQYVKWSNSLREEDLGTFELKEFRFTDEKGQVLDGKSYDIIPNLIRRKIYKDGIQINNQIIPFCIAEKKKIISNPCCLFKELKTRNDYYSYSIEFSIQTTPHDRTPLLLYKPVITRWVSRSITKSLLGKKAVTVYAKIQDEILYPLKLMKKRQGPFVWDSLSCEVLKNVYGNVIIPDAENYIASYSEYIGKSNTLAMAYQLTMGAEATTIGSGMPMKDKADIHKSLVRSLTDFIESEVQELEQCILKLGKMPDKIKFDEKI